MSAGSSRAPARAASARLSVAAGMALSGLRRRLRPDTRAAPRKRPILCGTPAISSARVSAVGGEVELRLAPAAGLLEVLHVGAAAGDGDRERPDLRDRDVVVDGALHDRRLHGEQPGDELSGGLRVVVRELDERAPEPGVLALAAAGGDGRGRGRRERRRSGASRAAWRRARARRRRTRPATSTGTASAGGTSASVGTAASTRVPFVTRSRSADAAASRSATTRLDSSGVVPAAAAAASACSRARRWSSSSSARPPHGGRARRRGRAARPRSLPASRERSSASSVWSASRAARSASRSARRAARTARSASRADSISARSSAASSSRLRPCLDLGAQRLQLLPHLGERGALGGEVVAQRREGGLVGLPRSPLPSQLLLEVRHRVEPRASSAATPRSSARRGVGARRAPRSSRARSVERRCGGRRGRRSRRRARR